MLADRREGDVDDEQVEARHEHPDDHNQRHLPPALHDETDPTTRGCMMQPIPAKLWGCFATTTTTRPAASPARSRWWRALVSADRPRHHARPSPLRPAAVEPPDCPQRPSGAP